MIARVCGECSRSCSCSSSPVISPLQTSSTTTGTRWAGTCARKTLRIVGGGREVWPPDSFARFIPATIPATGVVSSVWQDCDARSGKYECDYSEEQSWSDQLKPRASNPTKASVLCGRASDQIQIRTECPVDKSARYSHVPTCSVDDWLISFSSPLQQRSW